MGRGNFSPASQARRARQAEQVTALQQEKRDNGGLGRRERRRLASGVNRRAVTARIHGLTRGAQS